jgi:hypothetical protein
MELNDWQNEEVKKEISIAEMTNAVEALREAKTAYDTAKKMSEDMYSVYKEAEDRVVAMLSDSGLDTYTVKGIGKVTISEQLSVTTPKTPEEKQQFFDWLKRELGDDGFWAYATVNSQSLNSLYKLKFNEYASRGEVLEIDGLQPATSFTRLSFTKA